MVDLVADLVADPEVDLVVDPVADPADPLPRSAARDHTVRASDLAP